VRQFIFLLIVGAVALAACGSQATFGDPIVKGEPSPIPTAIVPSKPIYTVEQGDIVYQREYFGRVAPIVSRDLFFPQAGRVQEILVEDGADVQAGDVIAVLDTSVLIEQLRQAQTDLDVAQSLLQSVIDQGAYDTQRAQLNLDLAQLRLDYVMQRAADPPTAAQTFAIREREIERELARLALDEVNTEVDPELRVAVTRAEQRVADIQAQIDAARVIASLDGRLLSLRLSVGQTVEAFATVGVVADLGALEVQDSLSADDLNELSEGMSVTIKQNNRPGEVFTGKIVALPRPFGSGDDELTRIRFDNTAESATFDVGDRVSILVVIAERHDVLWLPRAALREFNGRNFVVVDSDGIQQRVDVELGLAGDDRVEIVAGVELDQTVIGP
jgi:multidrug efflux pump subunit AcrA (membrane-fusion protein)